MGSAYTYAYLEDAKVEEGMGKEEGGRGLGRVRSAL